MTLEGKISKMDAEKMKGDSPERLPLKEVWTQVETHQFKVTGSERQLRYLVRASELFIRSPLSSALKILSVAVAMVAMGALMIFYVNVHETLLRAKAELAVSVFLKNGTSEEEQNKIRKTLESRDELSSIEYVSKEDALKTFSNVLGENKGLLQGLETNNPLPSSFEVKFKREISDFSYVDRFIQDLRTYPEVESVQYNSALLAYFARMIRTMEVAGVAGALAGLLIAVFIISSTVRLALYERRDDLIVMKLVGASNLAICYPHLLQALLEGVLGVGIALWGLLVLFKICSRFIEGALAMHGTLQFLPWTSILVIFVAGILITLASAYTSALNFLNEQREY